MILVSHAKTLVQQTMEYYWYCCSSSTCSNCFLKRTLCTTNHSNHGQLEGFSSLLGGPTKAFVSTDRAKTAVQSPHVLAKSGYYSLIIAYTNIPGIEYNTEYGSLLKKKQTKQHESRVASKLVLQAPGAYKLYHEPQNTEGSEIDLAPFFIQWLHVSTIAPHTPTPLHQHERNVAREAKQAWRNLEKIVNIQRSGTLCDTNTPYYS